MGYAVVYRVVVYVVNKVVKILLVINQFAFKPTFEQTAGAMVTLIDTLSVGIKQMRELTGSVNGFGFVVFGIGKLRHVDVSCLFDFN